MNGVSSISVFTILAVLASAHISRYHEQSEISQDKVLASKGNHNEDTELGRQKRSIDLNPSLNYGCSLPLGLESGQVPDTAFSASSVAGSKNGPERARLNKRTDSEGSGGWAAKENNDSQWLQIDLGELVRVTKVATQGRQDAGHWVTQFSLSYSLDGTHWAEYKEDSVARVFIGNKDRNTIVEHWLQAEFFARFIRFYPEAWNELVGMRVEVYGCRNVYRCSVPLGMEDRRIPDRAITASSSINSSHSPSSARLNILNNDSDVGAWCPKTEGENQWLQIDLGEVTAVTKVATQGRYNSEDRVTSYTLSYSVDGTHWAGYKQRVMDKIFTGNSDRNTLIKHSLKPHIEARYIRFHPRTHSYKAACLRAELYGCQDVKKCLMPVGVEDGRIPNNAFTASSWSENFHPNRARLNLPSSKCCWSAKTNDVNQWLQVHLAGYFIIRGVAIQGRHDTDQWVTSFTVSYTVDDLNWIFIRKNSKDKIFLGNSDSTTVVKHFFTPDISILARSIRFHPKSWHNHISVRVEIYGCEDARSCLIPLGIESGRLPDSAFSASSSASSNHLPPLSRLNKVLAKTKVGAWCAGRNDGHQWLQVDFGRETTVTKVATQGTFGGEGRVTSYILSYSSNGIHWAAYRLTNGAIKVFGGNIDRNTPVYHFLHPRIYCKQLRFQPRSWSTGVCMRIEVYGCQKGNHCFMSLGVEDGRILNTSILASAIYDKKHAAEFARLNMLPGSSNIGAWCPLRSNSNQWLKIDLGTLTSVTKLATQGRQRAHHWVKRYSISYSINGEYWTYYSDGGEKKVFPGNFDRNSIVVHKLFPPIRARFVQFHPLDWHGFLCMRVELYGCPVRGI